MERHDGRLRRTDPVDELLPELAGRRVLRSLDAELDDTVPAIRAITTRDLLTFTFGFGFVVERFGLFLQMVTHEPLGGAQRGFSLGLGVLLLVWLGVISASRLARRWLAPLPVRSGEVIRAFLLPVCAVIVAASAIEALLLLVLNASYRSAAEVGALMIRRTFSPAIWPASLVACRCASLK